VSEGEKEEGGGNGQVSRVVFGSRSGRTWVADGDGRGEAIERDLEIKNCEMERGGGARGGV
jgi:hypothetical protein